MNTSDFFLKTFNSLKKNSNKPENSEFYPKDFRKSKIFHNLKKK